MTVPTDEAVTREAIEGLYRAFEQKSVPLLRKVVTPDWEYAPEPVGVAPGPDQMVPIFATLATALPDMKIAILDVLIHGDRVGVRAEVSGTQAGELLGIAASSRHISFAIHSFHQMRGSLIAKTWHLEDWLSVFRQLGQLPPTLGRS
ncbi:ester cyclase [Paraburkholderia fungorum]|uniref:Ester cyclase n=1 Tax=Paraburkholderia fungorum TaxID=134537 RepID=A0AAW3V2T3_9BURK|nr:ester cyclase [Paraburkholderia fungorum]MBB4516067.1 putative ester cyclase [Paraburkholderia fungorum]MBB6204828.1 putative ester cyclase [Paraburkholderia fungorum]